MRWSDKYCRMLVHNMQLELAAVRSRYLCVMAVRDSIHEGLSLPVKSSMQPLIAAVKAALNSSEVVNGLE